MCKLNYSSSSNMAVGIHSTNYSIHGVSPLRTANQLVATDYSERFCCLESALPATHGNREDRE